MTPIDGYLFQNVGAGTQGPFALKGGRYGYTLLATGAGSITLEVLGPDSATWIAALPALTGAPDCGSLLLPAGQYQWVISGFTAVYLGISRISE